MKKNTGTPDNLAFSLELRNRNQIKHASLAPQTKEAVLIEGSLGKLEEVRSVEGVLLEIKGSQGILRLDLAERHLLRFLRGVKSE